MKKILLLVPAAAVILLVSSCGGQSTAKPTAEWAKKYASSLEETLDETRAGYDLFADEIPVEESADPASIQAAYDEMKATIQAQKKVLADIKPFDGNKEDADLSIKLKDEANKYITLFEKASDNELSRINEWVKEGKTIENDELTTTYTDFELKSSDTYDGFANEKKNYLAKYSTK